MNSTKTARRLGTALAVPALLLVAACGSDDGSSGDSGGGGGAAVVTGDLGEAPEIEFDENSDGPDETQVSVVQEGDGDQVEAGDFVRVDAVGTVADGTELFSTWGISDQQAAAEEGVESETPDDADGEDAPDGAVEGDGAEPDDVAPEGEEPESAEGDEGEEAEGEEPLPFQYVGRTGDETEALPLDDLVGEQVGSRVLVEGTVGGMLGPEAAQLGLEESDGVAWVFDIVGATPADEAVAGDQDAPEDGMPEVTAEEGAPAVIDIPEEDAPGEFREQLLVEGDGPTVTPGEAAVVHYTGVTWEDGEMFDNSWERESATGFQVGTGAVIEGFDRGLEGKQVGDRVLIVVPPEMGYGQDPTSELADQTLVFVMDIVGVV